MAIALACVALTAATLIFIFYIERDPADSAPHRSRLDQLLERRDAVYDNLRDLRFEHRAGKLSEADYDASRKTLESEAAMVLAEIEKVTGGVVAPAARHAMSQGGRQNPPSSEAKA
ncbi:MAG TPA: hypothetical protein VGA40_06620 [Candidatus Acidoferrales bacterium]